MLVNCLDLKKKLPKEQCWKAPNRKYYSSEEGYMKWTTERRVKAHDTGEKWPISKLYLAPNGNYYTNEQAYLDMRTKTEEKNKCTTKMMDILGYEEGMRLPTLWYKKIHEFEKYGFDVVFDTICGNEKTFQWALENKKFDSEIRKIQYFSAVIQNTIMDYYKQKKAREKAALKEKAEEHKAQYDFDLDIGRNAVRGKDLSDLVGIV